MCCRTVGQSRDDGGRDVHRRQAAEDLNLHILKLDPWNLNDVIVLIAWTNLRVHTMVVDAWRKDPAVAEDRIIREPRCEGVAQPAVGVLVHFNAISSGCWSL